MEAFEYWPWLILLVTALFGLVVGSFLNVVIYRVPIMMEREWRAERESTSATESMTLPPADRTFNLWWPPSACPHCDQPIKPIENIPVLSYLWLRGQCKRCGGRISARYPLVEAGVALLSALVAWHFGPTWSCLAALLFTWMLVALAAIDVDHYLLPDSMTLSLMWAGLLLSLVRVDGSPLFVDVQSSLLGAAAGYLSLWSIYHLFKLATGKEGMGHGDFKLLAALGAWLGWQMLPLIILLSAVVGAVAGMFMIAFRRHERSVPIPFGPYLAAAGWIAMLWGREIVNWYLDYWS